MVDLDSVRKIFETKLNESEFTIPIQYENVNDTVELTEAKKKNTEWVRLVIRESEAKGVSIGSNVLRRFGGIVILSIFYPLGTGTSRLRDKGSEFSNFILNDIELIQYTKTPTFTLIGGTEQWFQANLTIPFELDQFTN